jgi:hypothetical protein
MPHHHPCKLRHHQEPNMDLLLEYEATSKPLKSVEWVKSHQDAETPWETLGDLNSLKPSSSAVLNIWCNKQAAKASNIGNSMPDDIYTFKKWAVYI